MSEIETFENEMLIILMLINTVKPREVHGLRSLQYLLQQPDQSLFVENPANLWKPQILFKFIYAYFLRQYIVFHAF